MFVVAVIPQQYLIYWDSAAQLKLSRSCMFVLIVENP